MVDVDKLVAELTLDEKAALTAGADIWSTVAVERLGIPTVRMTDGPNGARGALIPGESGITAACVPCGSALGATWNPALVEQIGALIGVEARTKACRVLLAPTVNIHRSPLGGRNFECYSEDPLLSGRTAAAFVRGVQSQGVATTVKHFVGNDAEFERNTISSVIDPRALREIYLLPFELAVREGGALGIMTSYNRLNGVYCTERADLLTTILREEWGFEGFVLTDWFGVASTVDSPPAGLDLEMPGPGRALGPAAAAAVRAGELDEAAVDAQARRLLAVFDRLGAFDDPEAPEVDSIDRPEHRALARAAAAEAIVLLKNDGQLLPLDAGPLRSVAVVGPNADRPQIMGGGSASFSPHYRVTPLDGLRAAVGDTVELVVERGCSIDKTVPTLRAEMALEFFADLDFGGDVVHRATAPEARWMAMGQPAAGVPADDFSVRATGRFLPGETGAHTFTLIQNGRARVLVDGAVVLDGVTDPPPPGTEFFGLGSIEVAAEVELVEGRAVDVVLEFSSRDSSFLRAVKVGHRPPTPADLIDRAVAAAASADVAVVVVGTTDEWESEGSDRTTMDLPGEQNELIRRVAAANPRTVVVVNTGSPVTMDWADDVAAVLQVWFGGQELGTAVADVLFGIADPGGRLPTTLPLRLEHNPSYGNFPGENGEVRYGESVLVGYRWYEARHLPVRFPFGHGLSYASFAIGPPAPSSSTFAAGERVRVEVPVTNTGDRRGAEVVQLYVASAAPGLTRPPKELKAYAKVRLDPGESTTVVLELDDRAFSYWDPGYPGWTELQARVAVGVPADGADTHSTDAGWRIDPGRYELLIGRSSADIAHVVPVDVRS